MLGEDEVFAKIDFKNAFNSVHRRAIAAAVLAKCPEAARYVEAAYGEASSLTCGTDTVSSEMGVQQGYPLGPALFSLAALECTQLPAEIRSKLRGVGWYLDDGLLVGPASAAHEALQWIAAKAASIGLEMNVAKTEILSAKADTWEPFRGP